VIRKHDQYLLLSWKTLLIIPAGVLLVLLHNLVYGLFIEGFDRVGHDEWVFFLAIPIIPLFFIISLVYTVIRKAIKLARNRTS
jgi:hypothetical protein